MDRCKIFLLTLAAIVGLGLTAGCDNDVEKESSDEQASAEAAKEEDQNQDNAQANAEKPPLEATGPVAVVDGEEIGPEKFNEAVEQRSQMFGGRIPPQLVGRMKSQTVQLLVDQHLIDKKLTQENVEVDQQEVDAEFDKFRERMPSEEQFQEFLKQRDMSVEEMKENMTKDLRLRKYLTDKYDIEVTTAQAKKFYEDNIERFKQPEQVHARHILIKTEKDADDAAKAEAKSRAEEVAKEANKPGTDFAELAKEKSEGPTASRGGDLGFFPEGKMMPNFSKAAFSMKPGEISEPVQTSFGFHVIKVEDRKEAGTVSFEEAQERITDQLKRNEFRDAMQKELAEIKEGVEIETKEDNIQVNVEAPSAGQGGHPMMGGAGGGAGGGGQLPPHVQKQLQEQLKKRQQQQQQQGGQESGDPTELELKKPGVLGK